MTKNIYFIKPIGIAGPVKIGCSVHPAARLYQLQAWSPFELEVAAAVPGNISLERKVHAHFADLHSHWEWFHADPRISECIAKLRRGVPIEQAIDLSDVRGDIYAKARQRQRETWERKRAERAASA